VLAIGGKALSMPPRKLCTRHRSGDAGWERVWEAYIHTYQSYNFGVPTVGEFWIEVPPNNHILRPYRAQSVTDDVLPPQKVAFGVRCTFIRRRPRRGRDLCGPVADTPLNPAPTLVFVRDQPTLRHARRAFLAPSSVVRLPARPVCSRFDAGRLGPRSGRPVVRALPTD